MCVCLCCLYNIYITTSYKWLRTYTCTIQCSMGLVWYGMVQYGIVPLYPPPRHRLCVSLCPRASRRHVRCAGTRRCCPASCPSMVSVWYQYGICMVSVWYLYGICMVSVWYQYDISILLVLWYQCGIGMVSVWYQYCISMISV